MTEILAAAFPPITALVADEEEAARTRLLAALKATWPGLRIMAEMANGADAWDAWLEHEPQVCFLDDRMPGLTGIDVARRIAGRSQVAFVMAHGDHARGLRRRSGRLGAQAGRWRAARPDRVARAPAPAGAAADVLYLKSDARFTRVVHRGEGDGESGGAALIRMPLKKLLIQLEPGQFWQIHRSVIANPRCIDSALRIDEARMVVTLRGRPERLSGSRHARA